MRLECGREKKHTRPHRLRRGSGTRIAGKNFKRHGRGRLDRNGGVDFAVEFKIKNSKLKISSCAASLDTSGKKRPRPSSSKDCGGWNIAATTAQVWS